MKALLKRKTITAIRQLTDASQTTKDASKKIMYDNSCRLAIELKRILEASPFNEDECEKKLIELGWLKR